MMARFYVPQPHVEKGMLRVEGTEVRHIRKVLRLKAGDPITIFDGSAKEYEGSIVELGPSFVLIQVQNAYSSQRDSPLEITLAQSLLKGEKMDYLIQKATELGIKEFVPFFSSRSVPLLEKSRRLERHRRWEKITIEASKQCGRGILPEVKPLQDYSEMLRIAPADALRFILWEKEGVTLKRILKRSVEKKKIFFIVGPEGGLSDEEVEESRMMGFIPVTLGKRIVRAETASLCLISILQYEWGDIG
jgi:16S rRNA (uracil1498-N3)-methyltransferase